MVNVLLGGRIRSCRLFVSWTEGRVPWGFLGDDVPNCGRGPRRSACDEVLDKW